MVLVCALLRCVSERELRKILGIGSHGKYAGLLAHSTGHRRERRATRQSGSSEPSLADSSDPATRYWRSSSRGIGRLVATGHGRTPYRRPPQSGASGVV